MLLLVDNGSAYTDDLEDALGRTRADYDRLVAASLDASLLSRYSAFVLSGRRSGDRQTNALNSAVVRHAMRSRAPLLGICYGAEILALTLGGTLRRLASGRRGLYRVSTERANPLLPDGAEVFESHRFAISALPAGASSLAGSAECAHELIGIDGRDVYGAQFHPEMSGDGRAMISRFVAICVHTS